MEHCICAMTARIWKRSMTDVRNNITGFGRVRNDRNLLPGDMTFGQIIITVGQISSTVKCQL